MGKVLPVGGIHAKLCARDEAGIKQVLIPVDHEKDTADLSEYVKDALQLVPVSSPHQVIARASVDAPAAGETTASEPTEVVEQPWRPDEFSSVGPSY